MIPPTPKLNDPYLCPVWRTKIIAAKSPISFASIIEKAKAEQRTEAPHQNEGE